MGSIEVTAEGGPAFTVRTGGRSFAVTATGALVAELGARDAETLVRASFEFLLAREPAGSILPRFDLSVIERYFPEWREEMRRMTAREPFSSEP
jgi:L-2-hydroxyglutarate oxidase LhgO